jgi:hypothetical protein
VSTSVESSEFARLGDTLRRIPAIGEAAGKFGHGRFEDGNWWVKFTIVADHPLAWRTVQELAYVLNYLSLGERLPTRFMPVSPPPYLNGGIEFLSWVIEGTDIRFSPDDAAEWLEGRLPRPLEDESQWAIDE